MQRIQVVENTKVVNVINIDDGAHVEASKIHFADGGELPAHAGCAFMKVDGAEIGWVVAGDTLVAPPPPPSPPPTPDQIKAECSRRVFAVASANCQMNMTAYVAAGSASDADKAAFKSALSWVQAMRSACIALVDLDDPTFAQDSHWPACPADAAALAARF